MAGSGKPTAGNDQSLGDLVALATKDLSQLVRYEIDLAKSELRGDIRRVAIGGALFGVAAFFGLGILVALFFAYAYMLHEVAKAPGGMAAAFALTAATVLLVAALTALVAVKVFRRMSGMKRTRASVTEGIGMLRREAKHGKDDTHGKGDTHGKDDTHGKGDTHGKDDTHGKATTASEDGKGVKGSLEDRKDRAAPDLQLSSTAEPAGRAEPAGSPSPDGQRAETASPRPPR